MRRRDNFILLLVLALLLIPSHVLASQGTAKVSLLKKTEDAPSMAQKALKPEATWIEKGNERIVTLEFLPLEFMGARGYLGEVTVAGQAVHATSNYQTYDSYNDPEKGSDPRVKGKSYPKTVTFVADRNRSTYDIKFYVPVMGEMGFGEQEARLRITWPDGVAKKEAPVEKKAPPSEATSSPLDVEDGLYSLNVALWHETEDKPSMGNGALDPKAELFVKNGKGTLFLGTKALKVSNIQASLSRVFYETDDGFSAATPLCYDLTPEGEPLPRPRIFALPLDVKKDTIRLKVDPKVAPMGDEPLNARLKLDFQSMKKIEADENTLARRAERGPKRPSFKEAHSYADKGVVLSVPAGGFGEAFEFYANALTGRDLQQALQKLNLPPQTKAYRLECRAPIESIPKDYKGSVQALGKSLMPQKSVVVTLPLQGAAEVYDENGAKIPSKTKDGKISFETKGLGVFFIKSGKSPAIGGAKSGLNMKPPAKAKPIASRKAQGPKAVKAVESSGTGTSQGTAVSPSTPDVAAVNADSGSDDANGWNGDSFGEDGEQSPSENALNEETPSFDEGKNDDTREEKERPGLIIFCLMVIFAALGGGAYMTRKYYRMYMDELMYEAEREREGQ